MGRELEVMKVLTMVVAAQVTNTIKLHNLKWLKWFNDMYFYRNNKKSKTYQKNTPWLKTSGVRPTTELITARQTRFPDASGMAF